jgi:hypothetical protein
MGFDFGRWRSQAQVHSIAQGFPMRVLPVLLAQQKKPGPRPEDREGKSPIFRLVQTADVVVENFGPGTMERLGLSDWFSTI